MQLIYFDGADRKLSMRTTKARFAFTLSAAGDNTPQRSHVGETAGGPRRGPVNERLTTSGARFG